MHIIICIYNYIYITIIHIFIIPVVLLNDHYSQIEFVSSGSRIQVVPLKRHEFVMAAKWWRVNLTSQSIQCDESIQFNWAARTKAPLQVILYNIISYYIYIIDYIYMYNNYRYVYSYKYYYYTYIHIYIYIYIHIL